MPPYANHRPQDDDYVGILNGTTNYDANSSSSNGNGNGNMVDIPLNKRSRRPMDDISFDATTKSLLPVPPPPPLPEEEQRQQGGEEEEDGGDDDARPEMKEKKTTKKKKNPGMMSRMLGFDLFDAKIPNPASALFKERRCAECGSRVYKYRDGGYEKEVVVVVAERVAEGDFDDDDDDENLPDEAITVLETSLLDFCNSNIALADDDTALSDLDEEEEQKGGGGSCCGRSAGSNETAVSSVKVDRATGVEAKIYYKKSCHEKRMMRIAHREGGYGLVLTDLANYHHIKAERERLARVEKEEARRLAAASAEDERLLRAAAVVDPGSAARRKGRRSIGGRARKALKNARKALSTRGCLDGAEDAVAAAKPEPVAAGARPVRLTWGSNEERTFGDSESDVGDDEEDVIAAVRPTRRPVRLTWGSNTEQISAENIHHPREVDDERDAERPAEPPRAVQLSWGGREETVTEKSNRLGV